MKLEEKKVPEKKERNKFFTDIPKDKAIDSMPTMKTILLADIEDPEEVEHLTRNCP